MSNSLEQGSHPARSLAGWVLAATGAAVILWLARPVGLDLKVYREGAKMLLNAPDGLYAPILGPVGDPGLPFTYPPFAALLFVPLTLLPFGAAYTLITAATVALSHLVVCEVAERLRPVWPIASLGWLATPLVLATSPFLDTMTYGQVNVVLMAACYLTLTRCRHQWAFGVAVGLTAAIKLTPLALLLLPLALWRWRPILIAGLTFLATQLLTLIIVPNLTRSFWGNVIWDPARVGVVAYLDNLSLRGSLERLGAPSWVWLILVIATIGVSAAAIRRLPSQGPPLLGFAAGCMLLISPISWVHHFVWWPVIVGAWASGGSQLRRIAPFVIALPVTLAVSPKIGLGLAGVPAGSTTALLVAALPAAAILGGALASLTAGLDKAQTSSGGRP